ncbi:hypothetical protein, partial [Bacillus mobilis]|uniref:hypothetical protein n=1 Tax=Bacillus mobilis TaxID=2026190 RepID=UPI001953194E
FSNISAILPLLSAIPKIYRRFFHFYQRFSKYIDLSTKDDNKNRLFHKRNSPLLSLSRFNGQ